MTLDVLIDLNVGMNRTGILLERAEALVDEILPLRSLRSYRYVAKERMRRTP
nr:hypothetical protein [Parabacteroides distasonis]